MKWIITFLAIVTITIACEKSPIVENESQDTRVAGASVETKGIVGTWKLTEYWEDIGNGTGRWVQPASEELIIFNADGSFSSSASFPLAVRGYNKYSDKIAGYVTFFPAVLMEGGDKYQYTLESPTRLTFFPICRESCPRRYQLRE